MKSAGTGAWGAGREELCPSHGKEVEGPEVIEVGHPFSSENDQVGIEEFGGVVGAGPWGRLVGFGCDFNPLLGFPVEQTDRVEALLVGPSPSEKHQPIVLTVVVHRAV